MSAPAFTPVGADGGPLDPTKSVRYVEGMVLGAGDFQQEHAYLAALGNEALRLGAGPGTLLGLKVSIVKVAGGGPGGTDKFEVHVGRGTAIDDRGRLVRVPEEQCADLAAWIAAQPSDAINGNVTPAGGGLSGTLTLWVNVSYVSTATDAVPVPGDPCRSDSQLTEASRWLDDYRLDLILTAPVPSRLKRALAQYLVWTKYALLLGAVPTPGTPADLNKLLDTAAQLLRDSQGKATPDRFLPPTLPGGLTAVTVNQNDFELQLQCLDATNAVLVAELLPTWLAAPPAPTAGAPTGLLLAELAVAVKRPATNVAWALDPAGAMTASSRARPVALAGPTLRVGPRVP
jgi:hypothetical protein